jgi:AP endonuclease-2
MRIITYNVNGLRAVLRKHGSIKQLLEDLQADIVCIQETKTAKSELEREHALLDGWYGYAHFHCVA